MGTLLYLIICVLFVKVTVGKTCPGLDLNPRHCGKTGHLKDLVTHISKDQISKAGLSAISVLSEFQLLGENFY